jgi:ABC-type amino acid transport substrate-binding protein
VEQEIGVYILPRVYEKLGLKIEIIPMPGKRAQRSLEEGLVDGEVMRIYTYGEEVPGVVRVEPAYFSLETTPYVRSDSGIRVNSADDLRKYRLVKVRGVKHTENITAGMDRVYSLDSPEQMFRYLEYGRADIALANSSNWKFLLTRMGCDNLVPAGPALQKLLLYHYISKRHIILAHKVGEVLKQMKESGELDQLIQEAEENILNSVDKSHYKH